MELTQQQLQHINNYLDAKGITYIDVRYEILDHICTEIERLMQNNYSFDEACNAIKAKWNYELRETSSYMLGLAYVKPKPIIKKTVGFMKKYFYGMWGLFILNMLMVGFALEINLPNANVFDLLSKIIAALSVLVILGNYYQIHKSRIKTTYKFVYQSQILPLIFFAAILGLGLINKSGNIEVLKLIFLMYLLVAIPVSFKLTKEHIQRINNFLEAIGIEYADIRFEMVDHIASEIEAKVDDVPAFFKHDGLQTPFFKYMMSRKTDFSNQYEKQLKRRNWSDITLIAKNSLKELQNKKTLLTLVLIVSITRFTAIFNLKYAIWITLSLSLITIFWNLFQFQKFLKSYTKIKIVKSYNIVIAFLGTFAIHYMNIISKEITYSLFGLYYQLSVFSLLYLVHVTFSKQKETIESKYQFLIQ